MKRHPAAMTTAALAGICVAMCGTPAAGDEIREKQWHLGFLHIREAHRISTGSGVTVAVIDTGVSNHSDLSGSLLKGADFVTDGGFGHTDVDGHGTATAGLIAAHGKNGNGALGIAPDAKILPIRVLESRGQTGDLSSAIDYAVEHGATVVNLSVTGDLTPGILDAISTAARSDVVVVAAAGNKPGEATVAAPAFLDPVVAVSTVMRSGRISATSAHGPEIDIAAPGEDMESTYRRGGYLRNGAGTSFSAAIVSGAAALLRSEYPQMSAPEVVERLKSTAVDKGPPGVDDEYGHGIVDVVAALSAGPPAAPSAGAGRPLSRSAASPAPDQRSSTPLALAALLGGLLLTLVLVLVRSRRAHDRATAAPVPRNAGPTGLPAHRSL
jgi:type VII secretion-associated serine protease mycosin